MMCRYTAPLVAALLALSCGGSGDARLARIDALMSAYQGEGPGASVAVIRDGQLIVRRAYGFADLEGHVRARPTTNYRLASMTKQFTAAAILLLAEQGRLSLDDEIGKYLPELPAASAHIPIRWLLSHQSGLIDYEEVMPADTMQPLHDADVLRLLAAQDRTYFVPGSAYRYSDSGYSLLSLIVARASGEDFASFLRERIFLPLGMTHSVALEEGISRVAERAYGYSRQSGRWVRTDQSLTSAVLGDGGVYSSVDDLAKWDAALYEPKLLSRESLRLAMTPVTATEDPNVRYTFGWRITGETVWHSGESIGFRNVIVRWPRRHFTVMVLTNRNDPEPYTLALAIAALYVPDAAATRASQVVVGPDSGARPLPSAPGARPEP